MITKHERNGYFESRDNSYHGQWYVLIVSFDLAIHIGVLPIRFIRNNHRMGQNGVTDDAPSSVTINLQRKPDDCLEYGTKITGVD